ncbi:DUF11 domain-containing protein [Streptomyces sp. NBC_00191]|uniref:hypothetical protein n=1 Tax=Streptomyces sp. NBC_00191 TaxID=2975674 RepID=UPI00324B30D4
MTVGNGPNDVAVTPDSEHAYVTNFMPADVSVIDTTTNTVTDTGSAGGTPVGIAISPIVSAPPSPSLTIAKSHTGNFIQGRQGTYSITVGNNGTAPTNGSTVTVQDTLPAGLTAGRITGSGWSCNRSSVTCTRSGVLAAGSSYPPITLIVRVARNAIPGTVTHTATVTGGGDAATHTATDPTTISPRRWQDWNWNWHRPWTALHA